MAAAERISRRNRILLSLSLVFIVMWTTNTLTSFKFFTKRGLYEYSSTSSVTYEAASHGVPVWSKVALSSGNDQDRVLPVSSSNVLEAHHHNTTTQKHQTIGYAISLIKCGDKQSTPQGLTDAALVLRHSIHQNSVRNPSSGSKYDYKMYALVHSQAEECSHILKQVGFQVLIVDPPLNVSDIRGEYLRTHIDREWCCGSDEFIKLHAYGLPEKVVVRVRLENHGTAFPKDTHLARIQSQKAIGSY